MEKFTSMIPNRSNQIDEEIYEILNSLTDFEVFKEMMVDYKIAQEEE